MKRPDDVPASAGFDERAGWWRDATPELERLWTADGTLMLEAPRKDGKLHGEVRWHPMIEDDSQFESRRDVVRDLGLPDGPTHTLIATFDRGELQSVRFRPGFDDWYKDTLVAKFSGGKVHGELVWRVGGTNGEPLLSFGETVLRAEQLKLPKPWPEKLVAIFDRGRLVSHKFFDAHGKEVGGDKPIEDWGAATERATLAGYVERGDFVADARRFFPKAEKLAPKGLPKKLDKLATLPAAKALEAAVRKKQIPRMGVWLDLGSFGFDCEKEALDGAADAKYVGVGSDGSGDMYLLDTKTGKVHIYRHEESRLEAKAFDSLDTFAWALLRIEAAQRGLLPLAALEKALARLEIGAAECVLERVTS